MGKAPQDPKEIFSEFSSDYRNIYGNDLVSIILYGSAAGKGYRPGKSDINFLIVLTEDGIQNLDKAFDAVNKWIKKKVVIPVFLTEEYIKGSLDVYPVEYLNFRKNYLLVYGKDVLKDLVIEPKWIRLQCEREIKGKLMLLRTGFLATRGKIRQLKELVDKSIRAFTAIFTALLYLKNQEAPENTRDLFSTVCQLFGLDAEVFLKILDVKNEEITLKGEEFKRLFNTYLGQIRKLAIIVDKMEEHDD